MTQAKNGSIFNNKTVIMTGGSSGLGKSLALEMHARGARVALLARNTAKLEEASRFISQSSPGKEPVLPLGCDVTNPGDVEKAMQEAAKALGAPDILVNNAGILKEGCFETLPPEDFSRTMRVNFEGPVNCTRAALPHFRQKGSGRILNVCSMAGRMGVYGYSAYCSSKHALMGFSASLRCELRPLGIVVQIAFPPEFESPMVEELNQYRSEANRIMVQTLPVMALEDVTGAIILGMEKGVYEIIPGMPSRMAARFNQWFPGLSRAVGDARIKKAVASGA